MNRPTDFKQYDSRWAYRDYSVKGKEKTNIYASGCGTYNTYFVPQLAAYGIKSEYLSSYCYHNLNHPSHAKVKAALKAGKWVIANAGRGLWTSGGHFILVYGIDADDNVYINDPASTAAARLKNKFDTFAYGFAVRFNERPI